MDKITVGIDVSKDRLDVAVRPSGEVLVVARNAAGLEELVERLRSLGPHLVALEATGGFETVVAAALAAAGLPVVIVNPAQVRAFAKAIGQRAKSDPIDARVIAHFTEATQPEPRPLPDEAARLLADLVARRRQIIDMIVAERQRERRAPARLQKSIVRLVKALEKELTSVDGDIDDAVRGSPAWRETEDLLASVPGVGPTIARTLIAELPELGTLDRKQIAALAGLAPHASIGPVEGAKLHRRRQGQRAHRSVHGRHGGQEAQPRAEGVLRQAGRGRQSRRCLPSLRLLASCSPSSMPSFVTTAPGRGRSWPPRQPSSRSRSSSRLAPKGRPSVGAEGMAGHPLGEQ